MLPARPAEELIAWQRDRQLHGGHGLAQDVERLTLTGAHPGAVHGHLKPQQIQSDVSFWPGMTLVFAGATVKGIDALVSLT